MGRSMLFLCAGMFIVFGIIQMGVFDRQAQIGEVNVEYVLASQSRNVANSGVEHALNRLVNEPAWRTGNSPLTYSFGNDSATITVRDGNTPGSGLPPNVLEIRSVGTSGGNQSTALARLHLSGGLPTINGAMGIFTDNLDFNVAGSAFLISGHDKNPDGTDGPGESLPGIAVNSLEAYNEIVSSLNASQRTKVQGSGAGSPSLDLNTDMDGDQLENFIQNAILNADEHYVDYTASGDGSLGTPANPKVIIVDGTLEVRNATGAGVIIIREGGSLDARGNFDNYQGLIIVQGRADMTRGNIHILGGMLFGGANPSIEIDIDFRGNVNVQYSSSVLNNIVTQLPGAAGNRLRLLTIYD